MEALQNSVIRIAKIRNPHCKMAQPTVKNPAWLQTKSYLTKTKRVKKITRDKHKCPETQTHVSPTKDVRKPTRHNPTCPETHTQVSWYTHLSVLIHPPIWPPQSLHHRKVKVYRHVNSTLHPRKLPKMSQKWRKLHKNWMSGQVQVYSGVNLLIVGCLAIIVGRIHWFI